MCVGKEEKGKRERGGRRRETEGGGGKDGGGTKEEKEMTEKECREEEGMERGREGEREGVEKRWRDRSIIYMYIFYHTHHALIIITVSVRTFSHRTSGLSPPSTLVSLVGEVMT